MEPVSHSAADKTREFRETDSS